MSIIERVYYLFVFFFNTLVEIYYHKMKAPKSDVSGQVFVITGGNAGIGKDAARQILLMNPKKVYITSRNPERGQKAIDDLKKATGKDNVELIILNLDSFASVEKAAEEIKSKEEQIHCLILNAGIGHVEKGSRTENGFETMYQSNHLGHHLFFELLLPNVRAAAKPGKPARVQLTSSAGHFLVTEDNLSKMETTAEEMTQYSNTKAMNILMATYYSKRLSPDVVINAVHPGAVASEFLEKFPFKNLARPIVRTIFRTVESGAATTVFVATHPSAGQVTGKYWSNMQVLGAHRIATDDKIAEKYMKKSFDEIKLKQK